MCVVINFFLDIGRSRYAFAQHFLFASERLLAQFCKNSLLVLLFIVCFVRLGYTQETISYKRKALSLYKRAQNHHKKGNTAKAKYYYLETIKEDTLFAEAFYTLGNLAFEDFEFDRAYKFYLKAVELQVNKKGFESAYFHVAKYSLRQYGHYESALHYARVFLAQKPSVKYYYKQLKEASSLIRTAEYAIEQIAERDAFVYKPERLPHPINHFEQQYFPSLTGDEQTLIFTARNKGEDENIYESLREGDRWGIPRLLSSVNSKSNEGTAAISADGRVMVFTVCEGAEGRAILGACDLFIALKEGEQWTGVKNLGRKINSPYWESQPSLSADGDRLYFVSDRPGGVGKKDIWVSNRAEDGKWEYPVNLQEPVNTRADEISPYIHANGLALYYSSDGMLGFGGLDIFHTEQTKNGWTTPQNIGYPLNNHLDQVGLFFTADGKKGYFSNEEITNRGLRQSKLYTFAVPEEMRPTKKSYYARGKIYDKKTKTPLRASVILIDLSTQKRAARTYSDKQSGMYTVFFTQGGQYALYVQKEGYLFKSLSLDFIRDAEYDFKQLHIPLERIEKGSLITLNNLFFASGSYELASNSRVELNKLIEFLRRHPKVIIEIAAHTDNVGTEAANLQLSEQRATAVVRYLCVHGVPTKQIKPKGYGDQFPAATNNSEIGRAMNRRVELWVLTTE